MLLGEGGFYEKSMFCTLVKMMKKKDDLLFTITLYKHVDNCHTFMLISDAARFHDINTRNRNIIIDCWCLLQTNQSFWLRGTSHKKMVLQEPSGCQLLQVSQSLLTAY